MDEIITLITFTYPQESYIPKGKLESEGIEVTIKDELTAQVNNFYSGAIGGVKLQVKKSDYEKAYKILVETGYILQKNNVPNKFLTRFDKISSKLPVLGKTPLEFRMVLFVFLLLSVIIVPFIVSSLPSTAEKLTENSWCTEKIIYKGQELITNTYGIRIESPYIDCLGTMKFRKNGTVDFPEINSYGESARWKLRNDSLVVTTCSIDNFNNNHVLTKSEKENVDKKSVYTGIYGIEIKNNKITLRSDSLTIFGHKSKFGLR